jgi:hypothetical protein
MFQHERRHKKLKEHFNTFLKNGIEYHSELSGSNDDDDN